MGDAVGEMFEVTERFDEFSCAFTDDLFKFFTVAGKDRLGFLAFADLNFQFALLLFEGSRVFAEMFAGFAQGGDAKDTGSGDGKIRKQFYNVFPIIDAERMARRKKEPVSSKIT
jgi:hypothetical protein